VLKNGPADRAGVKPGDVLKAVNGKQVSDSSSLLNLIAVLKPGETARLAIARKNLSLEYNVEVARRPPQVSLQPEENSN
jgi:serine protease DegQ